MDTVNDYLLWYAKDKSQVKYHQLFLERSEETMSSVYNWIELPDGTTRRLSEKELEGVVDLPEGKRFMTSMLHSQSGGESTSFPFAYEGHTYKPKGFFWKTTEDGLSRLAKADRLTRVGNTLMYKRYADDHPVVSVTNFWADTVQSTFAAPKVFVVQTATKSFSDVFS